MKLTSFCTKWRFILKDISIWKLKWIHTLLIRCKFMCCSQHFTIYLLSFYLLFFDQRRASYVIFLIYILNWKNSLVYASPLSDIFRLLFWKTECLPRMRILIGFINENSIFLWIHVIVHFSWFFFSCK